MTLWISNLMAAELTDQEITARVDALVDYVQRPQFTLLLVTNEVGAGIVPEYPSGRRFRDLVGQSNQSLAAAAHAVYWLVSGIPVAVK
jgi:adenosylcobinamide kinase/adenosylcobinamide-phosphate guanylyltransferase